MNNTKQPYSVFRKRLIVLKLYCTNVSACTGVHSCLFHNTRCLIRFMKCEKRTLIRFFYPFSYIRQRNKKYSEPKKPQTFETLRRSKII